MGRERKIIRLREYDYRQSGAYAVTLCVHERRMAFGVVVDRVVRLNPYDRLALGCWLAIPDHFSQAILDEVVVMPNHLHGILFIEGGSAAYFRGSDSLAPIRQTSERFSWHHHGSI